MISHHYLNMNTSVHYIILVYKKMRNLINIQNKNWMIERPSFRYPTKHSKNLKADRTSDAQMISWQVQMKLLKNFNCSQIWISWHHQENWNCAVYLPSSHIFSHHPYCTHSTPPSHTSSKLPPRIPCARNRPPPSPPSYLRRTGSLS